MKVMKIIAIAFAIVSLIAFVGCSKKITKTAPATQETKPVTTPTLESKPKVETIDLEPKEKSIPKVDLSFRNINFDYDKYDLTHEARDVLANHARLLKENPEIKLKIEGHCDERGTIEYNLALGENRAYSVKNYLVNYGINSNRLSTISYGKERPLDTRPTPEGWAKNRRAAFVILQ